MLQKIMLASVVAGALASPATAQMVCSERDKFLKHLGDGYSEAPIAMIQAVGAVVHNNEKPDKAFDLYNTLKSEIT